MEKSNKKITREENALIICKLAFGIIERASRGQGETFFQKPKPILERIRINTLAKHMIRVMELQSFGDNEDFKIMLQEEEKSLPEEDPAQRGLFYLDKNGDLDVTKVV